MTAQGNTPSFGRAAGGVFFHVSLFEISPPEARAAMLTDKGQSLRNVR